MVRWLRHFFAVGNIFDRPSLTPVYERCKALVGFYYLASVFVLSDDVRVMHETALTRPPLEPVWPLLWADGIDVLVLTDVLGVTAVGLALLAYLTGRAIFKILFSGAFLLFASLPNSLGGINHGFHAWFWISLVFALLPDDETRAGKLAYVYTFATAQTVMLLFYTMAGYWKVQYGILSLLAGQEGNFSPRGLALQLADRMAQTNTEPLLGAFLVDNYWFAFPMFLFLIYVQFTAVLVAFKPQLHIVWGLILVGFHTGTFLLMEIAFPKHIFLLMLLLVSSPFTQPGWFQWRTLREFPLLGR